MALFNSPRKRFQLALLVTLLLTGYQLVRVIAFIAVYGGIEHDSAWSLGAARSLAERGTYTSMISTLVDPTVPGGINIDGKFDIQDAAGRIWFRTSTSVGPASILPDALVLKLLGVSFWSLRAGPLLFYTLFLLAAAYILYQLAGLTAIVLFHAYLFFYPHLSIFLSYEALGEMPGMLYLACAMIVFALAVPAQRRHPLYFFAAGLLAGLAFASKVLTLLSIGGILLWAGYLWWFESKKVHFRELTWLGVGLMLPLALWELAQLVILTRLAGFAMYLRHAQQRWFGFLDEGSGLREQSYSGPEFVWRKLLLLNEIAQPQFELMALIVVGLILGGGVYLWLSRDDRKRTLLASIWLGWLANTVWFVGLGKTGWLRHYWFGLMLAVLLLSALPPLLIYLGWLKTNPLTYRPLSSTQRWVAGIVGVVWLALIGWGFVRQPYVMGVFLPDAIVPYWQERQATYFLPGAGLPWYLIPRSDQAAIIDYVRGMPVEANVYYPANQKGAEIALQTARIFYPYDRRGRPGQPAHPADILLIPASVLTSWRDPGIRAGLLRMVAQGCPRPVLENDNYKICLADQVIVPEELSGAP
ncbi:MAG: hypothetical protein BroJett011_44240 [Chloroflexota bacterium]|nr:MAG: hypothetical protein BroJett011_44240 [Chloroflexota bacterium]